MNKCCAKEIIFCNRYYWPDESATSQMLTDLCTTLAQRGWAVRVITSRQRYTNAQAGLASAESVNGVTVERVWSSTFGRSNLPGRFLDYLTFYLFVTLALLRRAHKGTIVVTKTDPPMLSVPGMLVAGLKRSKLVSWCQDVFPEIVWARQLHNGSQPMLFRCIAWIRNLSLRQCAAVVVISEDMYTATQRFLGDSKARLVMIPNWADGDSIRPICADSNPLRREWFESGEFVVGYSGNLGRVHDYQTILAASRLLKDQTDFRFLFIGSGALRAKLEQEVEDSLKPNFMFQPYQARDRLPQSLGVPDVHWLSLDRAFRDWVLPSKFYGIAAAGRPVVFIGDPASSLANWIQQNRMGFVVEPGDASALADILLQLRADPEMRSQMGCNSRAWFEAHGTLSRSVTRWENLLRQLSEH